MRRVTAGASTVPLTAIIPLPVASVGGGVGVVVARSRRFRGKTVWLGNIEALDFAEIVTPVGEPGFDAVQDCGCEKIERYPSEYLDARRMRDIKCCCIKACLAGFLKSEYPDNHKQTPRSKRSLNSSARGRMERVNEAILVGAEYTYCGQADLATYRC